LLGFFYRSRDNDRCFITEHVLDTDTLPKLPLRDEDNLDEIGSDSDGGIFGTLRILACRHGHVLLHCSASPYMLVRDPIRSINTFICEPSWRSFQTQFNGTIIYSSNHDASFTHNCHTSNVCIFWITTDNKKSTSKDVLIRNSQMGFDCSHSGGTDGTGACIESGNSHRRCFVLGNDI